ncbi:hypothetical protein [Streptomyces sp. NPDC057939]|uniref:hypothetical protein n=1 Tax=Streptomyces sp. NPDC057939 TaxID=3346284 RepID=UPI0036E74FB4
MPDGPRTVLHRVLRGPWGIRIELTASAAVGAAPPERGERVANGVWLDTTPVRTHPPADRRGKRLDAAEAGWLRHGAAVAAPAVAARHPGAHVLVTVDRVLFPEADFQPEGLAAAVLRWAEEEFALPPHAVDVTFDRTAGRYAYTWPPARPDPA